MSKTIKIKVPTHTVIELMKIISKRIEQNKEWIKLTKKDERDEYYYDLVEKNKNLRKIYRALASVKPILIIEEVYDEL